MKYAEFIKSIQAYFQDQWTVEGSPPPGFPPGYPSGGYPKTVISYQGANLTSAEMLAAKDSGKWVGLLIQNFTGTQETLGTTNVRREKTGLITVSVFTLKGSNTDAHDELCTDIEDIFQVPSINGSDYVNTTYDDDKITFTSVSPEWVGNIDNVTTINETTTTYIQTNVKVGYKYSEIT